MKKTPSIVRHALLTVAAIIAAAALTGFISAACSDTEIVPADVAGERVQLTEGEASVLLPAMRAAVRSGSSHLALAAGALTRHTAPTAVLVSVSNSHAAARVACGRGETLVAAVENALAALPAFRGEALETCWVKLDVVTTLKRLETVSRNFELDPRRQHEGIAVLGGAGTVILPETFRVAGRVKGNLLHLGTAVAHLAAEQPERWSLLAGRASYAIRRFRTDAWFTDGTTTTHLHGGRRLLAALDRATLDTAAEQAGGYLARSVGADGRFVYLYHPQSDEAASSYNVLRHAGSTWALLELCQTRKDPALRAAARRAVDHLLTFVRPAPQMSNASCIVEGSKVKLGGAALAVLALSRYQTVTGDASHEAVTRSLGRYILGGMSAAGRFQHHVVTASKGKVVRFRSAYFDGEATLALVSMFNLTHEAVWLEAARSAARHVITVRDAKVPTKKLTADHWMLYALRGLYQHDKDELYVNHGLRISESIALHQHRAAGSMMHLGATVAHAFSTPAATRTEGLVQAYRMARDAGKRTALPELLKSIHLSLAFELAHQFRPESALYFKDPARVLGAFPSSFENPAVRNDYVQHNLSAILAVRGVLELEGIGALDARTSPATSVLDERNLLVWAK